MRTAIQVSCNTYFYSMGHRVGFDAISPVAHAFGLGEEFDLPGTSQRYGTMPDSAWKQRRYGQAWTASDTLNATIGQGYVSLNPLQLAVMTARIASGKALAPSLMFRDRPAVANAMPYNAEFMAVAREGMDRVVNRGGTGRGSALGLDNVRMAGKTGTAQVRAGARGSGRSGGWITRDHGLFVCFAPVEDPRYAAAVVIEHGVGGARAAAPVAKDVFTFLYDRETAMRNLLALEAGWGGTPSQRLARRYAAAQAEASGVAPLAPPGGTGTAAPDPAAQAAPAAPATPSSAAPAAPPAPTEPPA
jgi:penicillin-binding protein 2